jgi:hypothetical protein
VLQRFNFGRRTAADVCISEHSDEDEKTTRGLYEVATPNYDEVMFEINKANQKIYKNTLSRDDYLDYKFDNLSDLATFLEKPSSRVQREKLNASFSTRQDSQKQSTRKSYHTKRNHKKSLPVSPSPEHSFLSKQLPKMPLHPKDYPKPLLSKTLNPKLKLKLPSLDSPQKPIHTLSKQRTHSHKAKAKTSQNISYAEADEDKHSNCSEEEEELSNPPLSNPKSPPTHHHIPSKPKTHHNQSSSPYRSPSPAPKDNSMTPGLLQATINNVIQIVEKNKHARKTLGNSLNKLFSVEREQSGKNGISYAKVTRDRLRNKAALLDDQYDRNVEMLSLLQDNCHAMHKFRHLMMKHYSDYQNGYKIMSKLTPKMEDRVKAILKS